MEGFLQDVGFAARLMRRSAGFTLVTILTLALGIGVNAAMFSIVDGVLLRPLPFPEPDRLVKIVFDSPGLGLRDVPSSVPEMDDLRQSGVFSDLSVVWPISGNLTGAEAPARIEFLGISPDYFRLLGVKPQLGRVIDARDEAPGFAQTVVISDSLWRGSFGADPNVLGKILRLDNDPYEVVGVLPPGFRHPGRTVARDSEAFAAAGYRADPFPKPARNVRFLPGLIGRLEKGLSLSEAQKRIDSLAANLRRDNPNDYPPATRWTVTLEPLHESLVGKVRSMLLVLLGAVSLIALIAAVNIANLLVARASSRQREIAVRIALGASRARIVRQLVVEALLLSLAGGVAGVLAAAAAHNLILRFVPAVIPRLGEVAIGPAVLVFSLVLSLVIGLGVGLVLAMHSANPEVSTAIREGSQGSGHGTRTARVRNVLIVAEISLAVVLMTGAGLLLRTFWNLLRENPGFDPSGVVTASVWLPVPNDPKADYYGDPNHRRAFHHETLQRLSALPGVQAAALASVLPASGPIPSVPLVIEGRPPDSIADRRTELVFVSPDYFRVLGIKIASGRALRETDETGKQDVALVDRTAANRFWPGEDPIGHRVKLNPAPQAPWVEIVGVIEDVKQDGLDAAGVPHLYRPLDQQGSRTLSVLLKTGQPPARLQEAIEREIRAVDAALPVFAVRSMADILGVSLESRRFSARLVGGFGVLALLLSSIGIYGLLSYMVSQRAREIGIRIALGAQRGDIFSLVVGRGAALALTGVFCGLVLAAAAAPALRALLFGVPPLDPGVLVAVALLLFAVALVASFLPARRAAGGDPMLALREG
ncbi:MAG: ABC transporter permease [Myxococcales bacterium]